MRKGTLATSIGALVVLYVVLSMLTTSCKNSSSPSAPDMVAPSYPSGGLGQTTDNPEPAAPATPEAPAAPVGGGGGTEITDDGKYAYTSYDNDFGKAEDFVLACYDGNMNVLLEQDLVGNPKPIRLKPGQDADFRAPLACGVDNQCDMLYNVKEGEYKKPPHRSKTLYSRIVRAAACPPPPPKECKDCQGAKQSVSCVVNEWAGEVDASAEWVPEIKYYQIVCDAYASHEGFFSSGFGVNEHFTGAKKFFSKPIQCEKDRQQVGASVTNSDSKCTEGAFCGDAHAQATIPACGTVCELDCNKCETPDYDKCVCVPIPCCGSYLTIKPTDSKCEQACFKIDSSHEGVVNGESFPAGQSTICFDAEPGEYTATAETRCDKDEASAKVENCCDEPQVISFGGCYVRDTSWPSYKLEGWGESIVDGDGKFRLELHAFKHGAPQQSLPLASSETPDGIKCHEGEKDHDPAEIDCEGRAKLNVHWKTTQREYAKDYSLRLILKLNGNVIRNIDLPGCK